MRIQKPNFHTLKTRQREWAARVFIFPKSHKWGHGKQKVAKVRKSQKGDTKAEKRKSGQSSKANQDFATSCYAFPLLHFHFRNQRNHRGVPRIQKDIVLDALQTRAAFSFPVSHSARRGGPKFRENKKISLKTPCGKGGSRLLLSVSCSPLRGGPLIREFKNPTTGPKFPEDHVEIAAIPRRSRRPSFCNLIAAKDIPSPGSSPGRYRSDYNVPRNKLSYPRLWSRKRAPLIPIYWSAIRGRQW